jgi:ribosome maturation factor RimP
MTVIKSAENLLLLDGVCPSDEAELLLQYLADNPQATVDLRSCEAAHTAVVQVLMAARPKVLGPPASDTPLRRWVYPALIAI